MSMKETDGQARGERSFGPPTSSHVDDVIQRLPTTTTSRREVCFSFACNTIFQLIFVLSCFRQKESSCHYHYHYYLLPPYTMTVLPSQLICQGSTISLPDISQTLSFLAFSKWTAQHKLLTIIIYHVVIVVAEVDYYKKEEGSQAGRPHIGFD